MAICRKCRRRFKKTSLTQKDCPKCSRWVNPLVTKLNAYNVRLKAVADQSGNPKIYTSQTHSQKFLRSLIPAR